MSWQFYVLTSDSLPQLKCFDPIDNTYLDKVPVNKRDSDYFDPYTTTIAAACYRSFLRTGKAYNRPRP